MILQEVRCMIWNRAKKSEELLRAKIREYIRYLNGTRVICQPEL